MDTPQDWRSSVEVDDDSFQQSLARLSQHIAARRAALVPLAPLPPPNREWRAWPFVLLIAVTAAATAGYHYADFIEHDLAPPRQVVAETRAPHAPVLAAVAVAPVPAAQPAAEAMIPRDEPPPPPESEAIVLAPRPSEAAVSAPIAPADPSIPAAAPQPEPALTWAEILEVQKRLVSLGIAPGPLDGIAGPLTVGAVQRYEQLHGTPVTGKVDHRLLKLLQQDAAAAVLQEAWAH